MLILRRLGLFNSIESSVRNRQREEILTRKKMIHRFLFCLFILTSGPMATSSEFVNAIAFDSQITHRAAGCDAFTPVLAADGSQYTSYGDCRGLTRQFTKRSMGLGRIIGGPTTPR